MQIDHQVQGTSTTSDLSERSSTSDDGLNILEALRKMMRNELDHRVIGPIVEDSVRRLLHGSWVQSELKMMIIRICHQEIGQIMEALVRRVVKEEIQSAQEKLMALWKWSPDETNISRERILQLKFSDEVSVPVLTGKAIEGKGDTPIRVSLVDKTTGKVVDCGAEASAKIEILVLEANDLDSEENLTSEDFNNRIIKESDKKKPHFARNKYVYLEAGVGDLSNVKLGHDKSWMKNCKCRLGARIAGNFDGIKVHEAVTEPFLVSDSRSRLYEKHYPPSLSDEVWRLDNIGRDGVPCKRLNEIDVKTVQDFLFLHSIDPQRLQKKVKASAKMWKATVEHAQTCRIDDTQINLYNSPSSELDLNVAFDIVGQLKGIVRDSHYIPVGDLSEVDKARAHALLCLAFKNRKDIVSFRDEASLMQQFPCESSEFSGCDLATSDVVSEHIPEEPVPDEGQSYTQLDPAYDSGPNTLLDELNSFWEKFDDNQSLMSLLCSTNPEILRDEAQNACGIHLLGAAAVMFWLSRVRKRCEKRKRTVDSRDVDVQKQPRFSEEEFP